MNQVYNRRQELTGESSSPSLLPAFCLCRYNQSITFAFLNLTFIVINPVNDLRKVKLVKSVYYNTVYGLFRAKTNKLIYLINLYLLFIIIIGVLSSLSHLTIGRVCAYE